MQSQQKGIVLPISSPVPVESGTLEVNGNSFVWESFGTHGARPLLLLHGTSLNRRSFYDVVETLGGNSHVVAVDIRGHGQSWDGTPRSYSTTEFSDDICSIIQHFWRGEKAVVVGASVSGLHGIQAASEYPELIDALVLVDILPTFEVSKVSGLLAFTLQPFESVEGAAAQVEKLMVAVNPSERPTSSRIRELLGRFLTPKKVELEGVEYRYDRNFLDYLQSQPHEELWPCLARIQCPILLLTPSAGSLVTKHAVDKFLSLQSAAAHISIPGSRHSIMHDQPELFAEAIQQFLVEKVTADSASSRYFQQDFSEVVEAGWIDALRRLELSPAVGKIVIDSVIEDLLLRAEGYHNLKHLSEMLTFLYSFESQIEDMASMILAVIAHDRIYDPRSNCNEERSIEWATEKYLAIGISQDVIHKICVLVAATKMHLPDPELSDSRLFLDADLAILSADTLRYMEYAQGIRHEYSHVPVGEYCRERARILEILGNRKPLYFREELYPERAQLARDNLSAEIRFLSSAAEGQELDFAKLFL